MPVVQARDCSSHSPPAAALRSLACGRSLELDGVGPAWFDGALERHRPVPLADIQEPRIMPKPSLSLVLFLTLAGPAVRAAQEAPPSGAHEGGQGAGPRARRLLVNNDGTNIFWRDDLSLGLVRRHVAE